MIDKLLSPEEASAALGVSVRTLTRYVKDGRLTVKRTPGGHRRFDPEEVAALLTIG